jgi:hypothetical protein
MAVALARQYAIKASAYFSRLETLSLPRFAVIAAFDRILRLSQAPTQLPAANQGGKLWASRNSSATFTCNCNAWNIVFQCYRTCYTAVSSPTGGRLIREPQKWPLPTDCKLSRLLSRCCESAHANFWAFGSSTLAPAMTLIIYLVITFSC